MPCYQRLETLKMENRCTKKQNSLSGSTRAPQGLAKHRLKNMIEILKQLSFVDFIQASGNMDNCLFRVSFKFN